MFKSFSPNPIRTFVKVKKLRFYPLQSTRVLKCQQKWVTKLTACLKQLQIFSVELIDDLQLRDRQRLRHRLRHLLLVHAAAQLHRDHQASAGQQTSGAGLGPLVHEHSEGKNTIQTIIWKIIDRYVLNLILNASNQYVWLKIQDCLKDFRLNLCSENPQSCWEV